MACAVAIQSQLAPCNALDVWRLADCYTLPRSRRSRWRRRCAASGSCRRGRRPARRCWRWCRRTVWWPRARKPSSSWSSRWWEAAERPEAELLAAAMKHGRLAAMNAASWRGLSSPGLRWFPLTTSLWTTSLLTSGGRASRDSSVHAVCHLGCPGDQPTRHTFTPRALAAIRSSTGYTEVGS